MPASFELAKQDPGKKAQLQKFMDYYLPTALKLLNTYASLPAQDVQGENIADVKKNIERSMDLLVTAFENQLDKLFQSDALDVSADCGRTGRDAEHGRPDRKRVLQNNILGNREKAHELFPCFFQSANLHVVQVSSVPRKAVDLQAFLPMVFPFYI